MKPVGIIMRRELASYFATPLANVFIVIFLLLAGVCTFSFGALFERGQASLDSVLQFPALALHPAGTRGGDALVGRGAARSGSIELLLTQPVTLWQAVVGKWLAAWLFVGIALVLTFPTWITVNYLGNPDNGAALAAYIGAFVMAGAYPRRRLVHVGDDQEQVIAFVVAAFVCLLFVLAGFPAVTEWSRALFAGIASWAFWGEGCPQWSAVRSAPW